MFVCLSQLITVKKLTQKINSSTNDLLQTHSSGCTVSPLWGKSFQHLKTQRRQFITNLVYFSRIYILAFNRQRTTKIITNMKSSVCTQTYLIAYDDTRISRNFIWGMNLNNKFNIIKTLASVVNMVSVNFRSNCS